MMVPGRQDLKVHVVKFVRFGLGVHGAFTRTVQGIGATRQTVVTSAVPQLQTLKTLSTRSNVGFALAMWIPLSGRHT